MLALASGLLVLVGRAGDCPGPLLCVPPCILSITHVVTGGASTTTKTHSSLSFVNTFSWLNAVAIGRRWSGLPASENQHRRLAKTRLTGGVCGASRQADAVCRNPYSSWGLHPLSRARKLLRLAASSALLRPLLLLSSAAWYA